MNTAKLFVIDYTLHGQPKSFIIRLPRLDTASAWHWAGCDAGLIRIGRTDREPAKLTSPAELEKKAIANVTWRPAGA